MVMKTRRDLNLLWKTLGQYFPTEVGDHLYVLPKLPRN